MDRYEPMVSPLRGFGYFVDVTRGLRPRLLLYQPFGLMKRSIFCSTGMVFSYHRHPVGCHACSRRHGFFVPPASCRCVAAGNLTPAGGGWFHRPGRFVCSAFRRRATACSQVNPFPRPYGRGFCLIARCVYGEGASVYACRLRRLKIASPPRPSRAMEVGSGTTS
jgi:hypothetical protein